MSAPLSQLTERFLHDVCLDAMQHILNNTDHVKHAAVEIFDASIDTPMTDLILGFSIDPQSDAEKLDVTTMLQSSALAIIDHQHVDADIIDASLDLDAAPNTHTLHTTVDSCDIFVPALNGVHPLPILAMNHCTNVDIHATRIPILSVSDVSNSRRSLRVICARITDPTFRMALASMNCSAPLSWHAGPTLRLPDMTSLVETTLRHPAAARRAHARHDVLFQELMRKSWSPDRLNIIERINDS